MKRLKARLSCAAALACCLAALGGDRASAVDYFWTGGTGSWTTGGNWDQGLAPEAQFEEMGIINNGGVATVSVAAANSAGLILGQNEGESGTLQVLSGGSISFVDSTGTPDGTANIGLGGTGVLEVRRGGSMSTALLDVNAGSQVILGSSPGSGTASLVSTGGMFLNGTTTVIGSGNTFSAAGPVTFEGNSRFISNLTSGSHTTLSAGGSVMLAGKYEVALGSGYVPTLGTTWTLADASSVIGSFASVSTPAAPTGAKYQLWTTDGGVHGKLLQLSLQAAVQLTVNTDTNTLSLSSPSGTPVSIAGYSVLSNNGLLKPAQWTSLQDQTIANWNEAGGSTTSLNELYSAPHSSYAVGATTVSLGPAFSFPTQFGVAPDLTLEYVTNDNRLLQGIVQYVGGKSQNNLLLTVDPATGNAQLRNSSPFSITLEGYSILSDSGSLKPANGSWNSLSDQSIAGWQEAAPTANALSELREVGGVAIGPGQAFSLGSLFNTTGAADLSLEFVLGGESNFRTGVVQYGAIPSVTPGDFNSDGKVNGADFLVWQRGAHSSTDLANWKTNYGSGSAVAAVAAVPEPATAGIMIAASLPALRLVRSRRGKRPVRS